MKCHPSVLPRITLGSSVLRQTSKLFTPSHRMICTTNLTPAVRGGDFRCSTRTPAGPQPAPARTSTPAGSSLASAPAATSLQLPQDAPWGLPAKRRDPCFRHRTVPLPKGTVGALHSRAMRSLLVAQAFRNPSLPFKFHSPLCHPCPNLSLKPWRQVRHVIFPGEIKVGIWGLKCASLARIGMIEIQRAAMPPLYSRSKTI